MPEATPPLLVGDHPAMDFLNTRACPRGREIEWIGDGGAFLAWLRASRLLQPRCPGGTVRTGLSPASVEDAATDARALREWWRALLNARKGDGTIPAGHGTLEPLNALLRRSPLLCEVVSRDGGGAGIPSQAGFQIRSGHAGEDATARLLGPIGHAIADLLAREDIARVRRCAGQGCTVMFLDRTKGGTRRWCSMATCGNRSKVAADRARRRVADAG